MKKHKKIKKQLRRIEKNQRIILETICILAENIETIEEKSGLFFERRSFETSLEDMKKLKES